MHAKQHDTLFRRDWELNHSPSGGHTLRALASVLAHRTTVLAAGGRHESLFLLERPNPEHAFTSYTPSSVFRTHTMSTGWAKLNGANFHVSYIECIY